ncbi:hypothetical protein CPT_Stills19 [Bacillus phage Stills]|uniref:Uncharacterized protein n=1 Tax=Bacillus phage Stills TaxID=1610833 RepID=A0A0E3X9L1_9CAUD|nr:hypothetical protein CPT_Stills19 [Bacillus phage Stills]AKC02647.1 hypothetical protein CPT_Stills19 [Bacillus phage Stills]
MSLQTILLIILLLYMIYGAYIGRSFYETGDKSWSEVFYCASCTLLWLPYVLWWTAFEKNKD